ncbi:MAG: hypothetical protein ACREOH_20400, partial [Candidatus Entotheonellia bacterium]
GLRSMILSVKGGHLQPSFTRELRGTVARESNAELGGLICLERPTLGMWRDVADAGVYPYLSKHYNRLQIRTIEELFSGCQSPGYTAQASPAIVHSHHRQ